MTRPPQNRDRCGSILMEFVLVAPLITLLVSFVLQMAHIWMARQITAYAAYCATRAVLAVRPEEQVNAAQKAAELACSWMSLAGLNGGSANEVRIPGWGTIPGSDSARVRVADTKIEMVGGGYPGVKVPLAVVTVKFKFPLLLPLAGRMISWAANHGEGDGLEQFDYGSHRLTGGNNPAWAGQQTVMNGSGGAEHISSPNNAWGADGKYPFITLTETCVLPMPYSTERFPQNGYRKDLIRRGGM